jgi:hypothetical protein
VAHVNVLLGGSGLCLDLVTPMRPVNAKIDIRYEYRLSSRRDYWVDLYFKVEHAVEETHQYGIVVEVKPQIRERDYSIFAYRYTIHRRAGGVGRSCLRNHAFIRGGLKDVIILWTMDTIIIRNRSDM